MASGSSGYKTVQFSLDGMSLLASNYRGEIFVLDAKSGVRTSPIMQTGLFQAAFISPDRKWIVVDRIATLALYSAVDYIERGSIKHPGSDPKFSFSTDGRYMLAYGSEHLLVWDSGSMKPITHFSGKDILAARLIGSRIIALKKSGAIDSFDLSSPWPVKPWRNLARLKLPVEEAEFSADGSKLAVAAPGGALELLVSPDWKKTLALDLPPEFRSEWKSLQWSPDGSRLLAVGGRMSNAMAVWDAETGKLLKEVGEVQLRFSGSFSGDGRRLAFMGQDHDIHLIRLDFAERVKTLQQQLSEKASLPVDSSDFEPAELRFRFQ